jgi:hypothetical protein
LGNADDDAGHILANRLGGLAVPVNIFPQAPSVNRGVYEKFEAQIYDCIVAGSKIKYVSHANLKWTFTYSGESTRPSGVTYSATFSAGADGCSTLSQRFSNEEA